MKVVCHIHIIFAKIMYGTLFQVKYHLQRDLMLEQE